jgi:hypothetical protein
MTLWMVEQFWEISDYVTPVRSVVEAETEAEAEKLAPEAVKAAIRQLSGGELVGTPKGRAIVVGEM